MFEIYLRLIWLLIHTSTFCDKVIIYLQFGFIYFESPCTFGKMAFAWFMINQSKLWMSFNIDLFYKMRAKQLNCTDMAYFGLRGNTW